MDSLKKFGEVGKLHFEKIILIAALILLGGAVFYLYTESQKEKEKIQQFFSDAGRRSNKPVRPADLTNFQAAITRAQNPGTLEFGLPHNLFNPVKWQQGPNGELIKIQKGTEAGPDRLQVTRITPLNFTIAFDRAAGPGYWINITNEVAVTGRRIAQFATLNSTNTKVFILREIKGPAEEPTELILELKDSGERIAITKDKPFVRPEAYQADLRYELDNKTFLKQRVGSQIVFGGEQYKIVAINQNEVVLLGGNDKKYTRPYTPDQTTAAR